MKTIFIVLVLMTSCTKRNPAACCETPDECLRLGTSDPVFCEDGACVAATCVSDSTCDGPEDCNAPTSCRAGTCSVPPDAPVPAFDVVYANVFRRSDFLMDLFTLDVMVINTGGAPLSLSSLTLKSVSDDHPIANMRVVLASAATVILPGKAGGAVGQEGAPLIFGSGLVTEPRVDMNTVYLQHQLQDQPSGTYDVKTNIVLGLDGIDVPIEFVTHVVPGQTIYADPEAVTRLHLTRP